MQASTPTWPRAATFLSGFSLVTVVAFADGGYFRDSWAWTTLALSSLVWIALLLRDEIALGRLDFAALAALAAFVGWVGLSATWSPASAASLEEAERALIYVTALLAFVLLIERDRIREHLAGVVAAATAVAAYGLGDRVVGEEAAASDPVSGSRLVEPLGYANALGILAALGLLLALGLALRGRSRGERALWLAPALVLVPTLAWTQSRGTSFALAVGLVVLAASERDAITSLLPAVRRKWPRVGAVVVAVVLLAAVAVAATRVERPLGPRLDYWEVAWRQWKEDAAIGAGAGTFEQYWLREGAAVAVRDAHSLYVETLAELGPVGLVLLLVALGVPMLAVWKGRDPLTGAAMSAYVAYLVHAGLDWDWEMPAVTLAGLLCGVALLAVGRDSAIAIGPRGRAALATAALVLAGLAVTGNLAN